MRTLSIPKCPRCLDAGKVKVVEIESQVHSIFKPLPEGWIDAAYEFRCECGWIAELSPDQAEFQFKDDGSPK